MMSNEHIKYIKKHKRNSIYILITQIIIMLMIILIWEYLGKKEIINTFITSMPSKIIKTIYELFKNGNLLNHIFITLKETLISFSITFIISMIISILIYESPTFDKIIDPYLTLFNSLPKVALGPLLIIWVGANGKSIILMAILISIIVSIQSISLGFKNTNKNRIKVLETFHASKLDILFLAVIPSNYKTIINTSKMNIGLCLIGVVMGEFLTSKAGIGYLILYGSQVFNLTLVLSGIVILLILSITLYLFLKIIEKHLDV